jgi:hypothetical protein
VEDIVNNAVGQVDNVPQDAVPGQVGNLSHEPTKEVVGHWPASQKLMRAAWQPPRGTSAQQLRAMMEQHQRDTILNRWPDLKLGVLDGRSPREVAGTVGQVGNLPHAEDTHRVRLLAAIMVLEFWSERLPGEVDFNELRSRLGLPVLGPIDPRQHPVAELPTTRLLRISIEDLSDKDLVLAYYRAGAFVIRRALVKFGEAIIQRPSLADSDERLHVYATLARNEPDVGRALGYIEQGRRAAEAKKQSSASWDLMELSLRFATRDGREAMRLIHHLQEHHLEEPGVGETLTRMLIDVGLLRPDGTPAMGPESPPPAMAAPGEPAAEPASGLWTPESAPSGGGGKLWTPE